MEKCITQKDNNDDIKIKRLYADDVGICGKSYYHTKMQ